MVYLSSFEFDKGRVQRDGVFLKTYGIAHMMAYVWMEHDRRYFISTASSLSDGHPYSYVRWRQKELHDEHFGQVNNEEAVCEELVVAQPKCSEIYYNTCAAIDQHNSHRQDTLCIKRKIETKIWDKRVTTSLFGMFVVDEWLMYTGATIDTLHPEP